MRSNILKVKLIDGELKFVFKKKHYALKSFKCIPKVVMSDCFHWFKHQEFKDRKAEDHYQWDANCWGVSLAVLFRETVGEGTQNLRVYSSHYADEYLFKRAKPITFEEAQPGDLVRFGAVRHGGTTHFATILMKTGDNDAVCLTKNGVGGRYYICLLSEFPDRECYGKVNGLEKQHTGFYTRR